MYEDMGEMKRRSQLLCSIKARRDSVKPVKESKLDEPSYRRKAAQLQNRKICKPCKSRVVSILIILIIAISDATLIVNWR